MTDSPDRTPTDRSLVLTRRRFVVGAAGLAVLGSQRGAVAAPRLAQSSGQFDWQRFKGKKIRLLLNAHPWTDTIKPHLAEFEKLTGVKVVEEDLPETQFRQKLTTELSQATGSLDVFMSAPAQEGLKYTKAGWYEPLDKYVKDAALTAPDYELNDFFPSALRIETVDGKLIGLPIQLESEIVFYRKDLFDQREVKVPTTFDELTAAAKALHAPDKGLFGIGLRGKGAAATSQFSSFLYSYGGDWMKNGSPAIATPEAIAAFKYYGDLARLYGPPGVINNSWPENVALFGQGKLGMFVDASVFKVNVEDPAKSQVAGKVGYAVFPKGPVKQDPASFVWGLSISSQSKQKGAAWYFVQWATSKPQTLLLLLKGVPVARASTWNAVEYTSTSNKQFDEVQRRSIALSDHSYNPQVVPVSEVRDVIGTVIITAIQGGNVEQAAKRANQQFKDIVERAG